MTILITDSNLKELHIEAWSIIAKEQNGKNFFYNALFEYEGIMDEKEVMEVFIQYRCFACIEAMRRHFIKCRNYYVDCKECPCDWGEGPKYEPLRKPCEQIHTIYSKYFDVLGKDKRLTKYWAEQVRDAWKK